MSYTVKIQRLSHSDDSTVGMITLDSQFNLERPLVGFTCEDEPRAVKVAGETRIPAGCYKLALNTAGGMNFNYRAAFDSHVGMIEILNVPNFTNVYIHIGNTEADTAGCPVIGYGVTINNNKGGGVVSRSRVFYMDFYKIISKMLKSGEDVWLQIKDEAE